MEDYGRDISLHFAVDSWAFFLFVELSEKHGDPFYEEGISLFDVEATLQPDGGSTSKKIFIFRREISRLSTDFIVIYHDSGCSLMGTLHC